MRRSHIRRFAFAGKRVRHKSRDIIENINGVEVNRTEDINKILSEDYKKFNISITRDGELMNFDVVPARELSSNGKRLGVLVKDSINGVGTVTYIDKQIKVCFSWSSSDGFKE